MTDLDRNSKADTVFLAIKGGGGIPALAVDLSQERTDLTNNTTYLQEASSVRTAVTYPRELSVCFTKKTGDAGILVNHGNSAGSSYTYRMRISGNDLDCYENGNLVVSVPLPGVAGSDRRFMAHWSSRPDLLNPGQVRSELTVYNFATSAWDHAFATHTACTTNTAWDFNVGGYGAGTLAYDVADIDTVRVGTRFHSQVEAREDWVSESTKPSIDGVLRSAILPIDTGSDVGTSGDFAGPAYLWSGASTRAADKRLMSPVLNMRPLDQYAIEQADYVGDPTEQGFKAPPGAPTYRWTRGCVWRRIVPPGCNRVHARAFIRTWTIGDGPCEMLFRMYSVGNHHIGGVAPGALIPYHGATGSRQVDDASDGGGWVDLGVLPVARDSADPELSTFMLAHSFDDGAVSSDVDETRFAVFAVTIEPFYQAGDAADGFPLTP